MAKTAAPNIDRFKACKSRITDYYEHNADSIREKKSVKATAKIFEELAWLNDETHRLGGLDKIDDKPRFMKIERKLIQVATDHEGAIRTGAFIQISSDWFAAYRYLVRCVEKTYKGVLEVEDQFALGGRLPDENNTVTLDLEEGLDDGEEEEPQPKRRVNRPRPTPASVPAMQLSGATVGTDGDDDLPGGDMEGAGG